MTNHDDIVLEVSGLTKVFGSGEAAVRAVEQGCVRHMIAFDPPDVTTIALTETSAIPKTVPLTCDQIKTARELGICLGD